MPEIISNLEIRNSRYEIVDLRDMWKGCSAWIVAGGPSLNNIPLEKIRERGCVSIGLNHSAVYARTTASVINDPCLKFSDALWADPTIAKFCPHPRHSKSCEIRTKRNGKFYWTGAKARDYPNVWFFRRDLCFDPDTYLSSTSASAGVNRDGAVKTGRHRTINTFMTVCKLLFHLGVREAFLLGCDFHMSEDQPYAFGQSKWKGGCGSNNNAYRVLNGWMHELRPVLEAAGMFIYQTAEFSGLTAFDHVPFDKALERCRNGIPEGEPCLADWYDKSIPTLPAEALAEAAA